MIDETSSSPRTEPRARRGRKRPRSTKQRITQRIHVVSWSPQREPVDDMFWCSLEQDGEWLVITELAQVRTRREIQERISELEEGIVAFDFPFSFPASFMEMLKSSEGIADWRSMIHRVREDLKRNTEDGIRNWVDRIAKYREAFLTEEPVQRPAYNRSGRPERPQQLLPHEKRSMAERFRRTEHAIRRAAEGALSSAIQIGYNRLTQRYEFNDPGQRGRAALMGMSMLDQTIEAQSGVAVWPFEKPGKLTVVEIHPWLFTKGKVMQPADLRKFIAEAEDAGLDIESQDVDLAARNPVAQRVLLTAMGMQRAESRLERSIRPIRDYAPQFYTDGRVLQEGWFYGVGYKVDPGPSAGAGKDDKRTRKSQATGTPDRNNGGTFTADPGPDIQGTAAVPEIVAPHGDMAETGLTEQIAPTAEYTLATESSSMNGDPASEVRDGGEPNPSGPNFSEPEASEPESDKEPA